MTVKYYIDEAGEKKIVLKDGKVSCTCCEGPEPECCMYPAQALTDGLYSNDDLPDAIVITYSTDLQTFGPYTLTRSGSVFSGGPSNEVVVQLAGDLWAVGDGSGGIGSFPCLINEEAAGSGFTVTIEDQFADTYTVAWNISDQSGSSTATRQSLCIWTFTALGEEYLIEYESVDFFRWRIVTPETEIFKGEPSFENTPTGFYVTGGAEFTVS